MYKLDKDHKLDMGSKANIHWQRLVLEMAVDQLVSASFVNNSDSWLVHKQLKDQRLLSRLSESTTLVVVFQGSSLLIASLQTRSVREGFVAPPLG